ncbi:hypothetical protein TKK_0018142 [Trichogramma kaykai]|uniref:Uncharacterized protein n=1 Tax=Trichogramma kaykai TaxID=54128 RepID=A0ABD2W0A2_9HYME
MAKMQQQICRTCLATCGELVNIFSEDYYVHNLSEKLYNTTNIEVQKNDDLPQMMCKKCIFMVDSLYCFKDQCEMADIKLKKSYKIPMDISKPATSSEDEYQVEYASEEARLEVERVKKLLKSNQSKFTGPRLKLENNSKNNQLYKSHNESKSSSVHGFSENDEDMAFVSESDVSSIYIYPEIDKHSSKSIKNETKPKLKRKISQTNNVTLSKVPKKVAFRDDDYEDNVLQIESVKSIANISPKIMNQPKNIIQIDIIDDDSEMPKDNDISKKNSTCLASMGLSPMEDIKTINELRMKNLIKQIILDIPDICPICSQQFESYLEVLKHKIECHIDHEENDIQCPVCNEKFYSSSSLVDHLNEHVDIKLFVCALCSKHLHTEGKMRSHLESHVDMNILQCLVCNKKLGRIQQLFNHLDTHLHKLSMACTICNRSFDNKIQLQVHINVEHRKLKEKMYKCKTCGEQVAEDKKVQHFKSHSNYACSQCEKTFDSRKMLRNHSYTHHNDIKFSCDICNQSFGSLLERTQHKKTHNNGYETITVSNSANISSDTKKFRCRVCFDILVSRAAYGKHLKEKHWNSKQTAEILKELTDS